MGRGLWLWAVIAVALVVCLPALGERAAIERADLRVEVVLDQDRVEALSEQAGVPVQDILVRLRAQGATAVAVSDFEAAKTAAGAGLRVVPRTVQAAVVAGIYGWDVGPVIFSGDRVGGYPDRLPAVAALMEDLGAPLGLIEFTNQAGASELARLMQYRALRVHSISMDELARLDDAGAAARLARAARERRARVLYVRPLVRGPADEMVARNEAYLADIARRLAAAGLEVGPAEPMPLWTTRTRVPVAAAAAASAGAVLLLMHLWRAPWWLGALAVLGGGGAVYGLMRMGETVFARQAAALAVALVFPALAVVAALRLPGRRGGWVLGVFAFVAVTAAGAALVAASLGDTRFLLQLEQFRGVKLAHVAPLAVVALFWVADQYKGSWYSWLTAPVRVWHVLVGGLALLLAYVYVGRTGNDMVGVLELERALRVGLEDALVVRPRTKEFLLGYPAVLLGFAFWTAGRRAIAWPLLVTGTIASVSAINTFAHAHSPLAVSAVRSAYGLAGGSLVALVVWLGLLAVRQVPAVRRLMATGGGIGGGPAGWAGDGRPTGPGTGHGPATGHGRGAGPGLGSGAGRGPGAGPG